MPYPVSAAASSRDENQPMLIEAWRWFKRAVLGVRPSSNGRQVRAELHREAQTRAIAESERLLDDLHSVEEEAKRRGHPDVLSALIHDMRGRQQRDIVRRGE